jgi:thiol-disulfide isomerase/thioredoxin
LEAARVGEVVSNLLDAVESVAWTDPGVVKPVLAEYLSETQKKGRGPWAYQWIAREERAWKFTLDSEDPALAAGRNIVDLEEAVLPMYDFTVTDLEGKPHRLSDQRGKVVLLNFWATWCPPCRGEMPLFDRVQRASKELAILLITDEDAETVASFMKRFPYDLPAMLDGDHKVFDRYDVLGIPRTYVLDRTGRIFDTLPGAFSETELLRVLRAAGME